MISSNDAKTHTPEPTGVLSSSTRTLTGAQKRKQRMEKYRRLNAKRKQRMFNRTPTLEQ